MSINSLLVRGICHVQQLELRGDFLTRHIYGIEKTAGSIESRSNRVWRLSRRYSRSFFFRLSFTPRHLSSPPVKDFALTAAPDGSRTRLEQNHKSFSLPQLGNARCDLSCMPGKKVFDVHPLRDASDRFVIPFLGCAQTRYTYKNLK